MRKIVCIPDYLIPQKPDQDTKYFSICSNPQRENVGYFGLTLIQEIRKHRLYPSQKAWDFCIIAFSITVADKSVKREASADGWTRQIDLTVHLCNPIVWEPVKTELERTLRFLTGDYWYLTFKSQGVYLEDVYENELKLVEQKVSDEDCICFLSGGVDSLVGSIDLVSEGRKPLFVSQGFRGDCNTQNSFAEKIRSSSRHFQWKHSIHLPNEESEGSTRGRSIMFFAFAALSASAIYPESDSPIDIYIPENGFISINIPFNSGRIGSLSTKTTHPTYLDGIQNIWDKVGFKLNLRTPYRFKTKGELLSECKDQQLLKELIFQSVSCGKYRVYNMHHCGRCLPCLVRRAAILHWGEIDHTLGGYAAEKMERIKHGSSDEVGAAINACLISEQYGIDRLISGNLYFAGNNDRLNFKGVFSRGLGEIEEFLKSKGIM